MTNKPTTTPLGSDHAHQFVEVALPVPLRRLFDYCLPDYCLPEGQANLEEKRLCGSRVWVTFGRQKLLGVVVRSKATTDWPVEQLKSVEQVVDSFPWVSSELLALSEWIASYYHQPIGEVLQLAMPPSLRKGRSADGTPSHVVRLLIPEWKPRANARKQQALKALLASGESLSIDHIKEEGWTLSSCRPFVEQGILEVKEVEPERPDLEAVQRQLQTKKEIALAHFETQKQAELTPEQQDVVTSLQQHQGFHCALLEGVTGSGKTQVYIQWVKETIAAGRQALLLIPEIGLTPQTYQRFYNSFGESVAFWHSGLSDNERLKLWQACRQGEILVVIGTRSALFTPFADLGVILVDEEHDPSFRQQDQVRYSARDAAIKRAQLLDVPIVLGSATPSLETLANAHKGRFSHWHLNQRATGVALPQISLKDVRHMPMVGGVAASLLEDMKERLAAGEQVMVFLNRRGYAPSLYCFDCGWIATCRHCDAALTIHRVPESLCCHHCDARAQLIRQCPQCLSQQLGPLGQGTERIEEALSEIFDYPVVRIDRDTTQHKKSWEAHLEKIALGEPMVLVGTQMVAKGHHFPKLNWVLIADMDAMLFSADERSLERSAQLFTQVAGRAGREQAGQVVIQSRFPDHSWIQSLTQLNYSGLAQRLLDERAEMHRAPFGHAVMIRAESPVPLEALNWLERAANESGVDLNQAQVIGPQPAPMELRQGRFRAQWHWTFQNRAQRHQQIRLFETWAEQDRTRKIRWSIDVDPVDHL